MSPYRADRPATTELRFQARIATVRTLIRRGDLDPYDGLALVTGRSVSMRHPDREQTVVYAWGTPTGLILGRTYIDWRASRLRAYGLAPELVCEGCGCLLDPPAHSPRCKA